MADKTTMVLPGNRFSVPKVFKRVVQVALAVGLPALVALSVIAGNAMLTDKKGRLFRGVDQWLAFINRPDILATMVLTALVTVMLVYWQRDQERGRQGRLCLPTSKRRPAACADEGQRVFVGVVRRLEDDLQVRCQREHVGHLPAIKHLG